MLNSVKWTSEMTEKLIRLKHDSDTMDAFKSCINNPRKMKECWVKLGENFIPHLSSEGKV